MRPLLRAFALLLALIVAGGFLAVAYVTRTGLSARGQPGRLEAFVARRVRDLAVARHARGLTNPIPRSAEAVEDGLEHFADHCAICHANDGSGNTEMGRNMWPRAPDMRRAETQRLSDGELFWIVEHGIRFTGMPGWGTGDTAGEEASWRLVHFIRALPELTPEQLARMEELNPRSPEEIRQQIEEERFLEGGEAPGGAAAPHKHPGGQE